MKKLLFNLQSSMYILLCIGIGVVVLTNLALFHPGFFRPHDYTHAARIAEMNRSLISGEFPVRWSENFGFGYGMPLFNFYAPLPYYIAQIPYIFTQDAIISIKFLYIVNAILSCTGMYLLASEFWKNERERNEISFSALLSSLVFSFSTYRALDLYVRGAIGEVYAMAILPFALYGVLLMQRKRRAGILFGGIALAGVLLSHNLIGMISVGLVGIFSTGAFLFTNHQPKKQFFILLRRCIRDSIIVIFVGVGISSFYVLPAFFEKTFTRVEQTITTGYFDYHNHFVALRQFLFGKWGYGGSVPGLEDGISFSFGYVSLVLAMISLVSLICSVRKKPELKILFGKVFLCGILCIGSLFMVTNRSVFIWDHIQILKYLQFPWRFLTFAHIFFALGIGLLGSVWEKKYTVVLLVLTTVAVIALQASLFQPERFITQTDEYYSTKPEFIRSEMSKTLNDYLPNGISEDTFPAISEQRVTLTAGTGTIHMLVNRSSYFSFLSECATTCNYDIHVFQFPGWVAIVDGMTVDLAPTGNASSYQLVVPSGKHAISVQLRNTPVRSIGNWISVGTIFALFAFCFSRMKRFMYE